MWWMSMSRSKYEVSAIASPKLRPADPYSPPKVFRSSSPNCRASSGWRSNPAILVNFLFSSCANWRSNFIRSSHSFTELGRIPADGRGVPGAGALELRRMASQGLRAGQDSAGPFARRFTRDADAKPDHQAPLHSGLVGSRRLDGRRARRSPGSMRAPPKREVHRVPRLRRTRAGAAVLRDDRSRTGAPLADDPRLRDERRASSDSARRALPAPHRDAAGLQDGEVRAFHGADRRLPSRGKGAGRLSGGHPVLRSGSRDLTTKMLSTRDCHALIANHVVAP